MSKTVDERVVEMRFDNKQFEANVKTSMSTLDKLKSSLKLGDASKGLENIDKASKNISFDTIASGVEALQKRFSTFGIVGMRVIQNITDSMMGLASKTTSFLTDGIIQGGKNRAMNLENAHFQLQGLLKDEEAVAAVMKNVSDSVDGTAYSLDSAAKVASQLAASGMRAGDQMFSSLRAVAGVAAMTNSEYDEIGRIFTKVAGQGRLMGDDLLSLSSRGMNAAATLGTYLHKSEAEVREMVSKGKLDFQTFAAAMDDAFGEHAKKANETFTGALSNIRAALARIGALFISPLVEQNGALVQLFNAIRQRINDIKSAIQPVADLFVKGVTTMANALTAFLTKLDIKTPIEKMMNGIIPKWDQFSSKLEAAGISADDFQKKLTEVAGKHGVSVDSLIQKYGSLGKVMSAGKISKSIIIETLKSFVGIEKSASAAATEITGKLETFNKVTREIINGNYGNSAARVKALTDAGYEYATMQKLVNYVWERNGKTWKNCNISADELTNAISGLSKEELKSIGYTEEQASKIRELAEEAEKTGTPLNELISKMTKPSGKELIIDSFRNALKGLSGVMSAVKNAFAEMVKPFSTDVFTTVAEKIHSFSEKLVLSEENADKLKRTFKGLFSVLDLIRSIVGGAFRTAFNILSAVLGAFNLNVLDVTAYIGDAITKFRDWIKEHNLLAKAIEVVVPIIKSVADSIGNWVKNNEKIQNGIKNLISFLDSAGQSISNWIDGLKETDNIPQYIISGFINGIKSGASTIVNAMIELGRSILSAIKGVLGIHSPSTEFFAIGENVIQGFINGIKSGVSALLSLVGDIGNQCIGVLSQIDFAKIFAVGISGGIIYTANNLLNTIKAFAAPAAGIGHMTNSIGSFFDALSESIKPNKWKNMSKTIMELAVAVGILSASVYALAQLETGKLWGAIGALGALAAILGVLSFAVSKMDVSGGGFSKLSLVLVGVTASLYVMASAIKKLEFLNEDNIAPVLGGLTAMITGLAAILLALGKLTKGAGAKDISKAGSMLIKISAAMMLMTLTIKAISKLEPTKITKGIVCMTLFGGLITGLMAATKLAGKDVNNLGSVILKVSAAMLLTVGVIKVVSGLEPSEITKGVICMTLFGGLITGLMAATKLIGKNVGKIGSAIMGVSAAMMLMALTIKIVANMEPSEIAKGVVCITLFGGIVTGLIAATRLAGGNNLKGVAATLLAMSLSIGILAGVAIILSLIDLGGLAKGITAVGLLSAMMTAIIYATKGAQDCKGNIIAMTVAIGLMAASIAALSFIDTGKLAAATLALSMVMGMFALVEKMASNLSGAMGSILAISVAIGLLAGILYVLSGIPTETLIPTAVSLSTLLLAMSGALAILSKIGSVSASAIGSMALLGLVVAELGAILGVMAYFNIQPSIETATSLSVLLLAMSGALGILTLVGAGGPAAFIGVGALATLIAAIGGLMVGIGALVTYIPDMQTWLNTGMAVLEQIGYGLGSFFGNIVGGFLGGVSAGLPEIGTNISQFMLNMQPFFTAISGLDEGSTNAVKALAETILILTGAGFIDGITSWLTGGSSLSSFGEQLVPFGEAIKEYGDTVAGINTSGIQASVTAGHALAELANALPNSGGVAGFFAGNNDMDTFGSKLEKFGKSLVKFSNTVSGLNISGVKSKLSGFTKALTTLGKTGVDSFVKSFSDSSSKVTSAAQKMITTFVNAAKGKQSSMTSTFKSMMNTIVSTIRGTYSSYYSAGAYVVQGFANGISANTYLATAKARAMANAAKNAAKSALDINSPSKVFMSIGKSVGEGFEKGISDKSQTSRVISSTVGLAGKVISSACDTLGINSPSRAFMAIGRYIGEGLAQGIRDSAWQAVYWTEDTAQKVIAVASKTFEDVEKWVEDAKAFDELSLAEELEIWEAVIEKYGEGTEERTKAEKKAYSVYKELQKENYENSKNWIDAEKEYNRLSLQEELEAWQRIQARYVEGTDERKEADKQVYKLKHELIDDSIEALEQEIANQDALIASLEEGTVAYANAVKERSHLNDKLLSAKYDNSMNWIDRQDTYNLWDGLADKLAAYTRVLKRHKKGTEEYEKAAKEIYNIEKEIYEARESYNEDVEKIQNEAAEKRIELEEEKADKIKEINEKLQSDIQAADEKYTSKLESRTKSLYDAYGLFDEVKEKETVNSATLIKNLQDQVDEFKDWQKTLDSLSARGLNESLVEELSEMGPSAIAEIKALSSMSDSQLQQYATLWSTKHKQAKNKAVEELEDLRIETNTEIRNLKIQANKDLDEYCNLWNEKMKTLNEDTSEQLDKLREEFNKKVGLIKSNTEAEIKKMSETAQSIMREAGWDETGQAIVAGMSNGVGTGKTFIDKMKEVAINAVNAVEDVLENHSPLGMFMDEGIVVGLTKYSDRVSQASENVGRESISAISSSISRISDVINSDINVELTITPVIDLTNVRNGIGMINGVFGANRSMNLGMAIAANNQNGNSYQSELFGKMQDMAEKATSKLTSAIDSLRSDFNDMTSKLERMQVVLDSGALVGEIAPDMDSALGGLAKMNRRGVR